MKVRTKLTLLFSFITTLTLLVLSISVYMFTQVQMVKGIQAEMLSSVQAHVNKLDGWLIGKAKMLEITAGTLQSAVGDGAITVSLLAGYKTVDKELSDMYFGAVDGKLVTGSGWIQPADYDPRVRTWYKSASEQGKLVFSDPYVDMSTKQMAVSVAMPLKNSQGQLRGVVSEDILLQTLVDNVKEINLHGEGYAFLLDAKGMLLAHPNPDFVSRNFAEIDQLQEVAPAITNIIGRDQGFSNYRFDGKDLFLAYQKIPATGWTLAISVPEAVIYKPLASLKWLSAVITLVSVCLVILLTFFMAKRLTKPLEALAAQAGLVANGDLTIQAPVKGRDEIAELAAGFNQMIHNLRGLIVQVSTSAEQIAASSQELTASSHESAQASNQVAESVATIANGTDRQRNAVEETAVVVDRISFNIEQAAGEANQTVLKSTQAADKAKESSVSINQAVRQMGLIEQTVNNSSQVVAGLGERSKEIGQIVDTIAGIAGQTNLLALNAAIEAARAGEQGRGFAVVAEEVRKLAEQSQAAAKQIAGLIGEIQKDTLKAVAAMDDGTREVSRGAEIVTAAGGSFQEIAELVTEVLTQVTQISVAMTEMDNGSQQIVASVRAIDGLSKAAAAAAGTAAVATEEQSASSGEIAAASQNLADMAQKLQETISRFRL
ncbi:methyl-accepting chemotaxis protein [Sporomusa termitida]|uniref:Methyl-accepting chemotaxis protein McpA n=1 Tax=Sporomusa termitida TaxID=2377 RepID=A0A517DW92_9FIRM|nr:methyl-accepting chemotaxis protein [Sporomusa termitida]QDR81630.1 Methyl-accepting chemotaxis protein McpA [Sporomusa termitida]